MVPFGPRWERGPWGARTKSHDVNNGGKHGEHETNTEMNITISHDSKTNLAKTASPKTNSIFFTHKSKLTQIVKNQSIPKQFTYENLTNKRINQTHHIMILLDPAPG